MRLGVRAAIVDGIRLVGDVEVDDGIVRAVGVAPAGPAGLAVPGFVDLQVNGFAGVDFTHSDPAGYREAAAAMARTGVTSFLATIPTAAAEDYDRALATAAAVNRSGADAAGGARLAGVHLEGPFLSPQRAGAHRVDWLRDPDIGSCQRWVDAAPVAMMTVAPELPGALDLIAAMQARGVVVCLGHSDGDAAAAHAGFDAGASAVTHLWNAQRPMTAREPGMVGVALARPDVAVCVIADLVHVASETLTVTARAASDRLVVVTDAVAPAGLGPGAHTFAGQQVTTDGRSIRLADGTLAGSACPMDQALRNLAAIGVPIEQAVRAMTEAPARLLGRDDLGQLRPGAAADIVVLDDDLEIAQVLIAGRSLR